MKDDQFCYLKNVLVQLCYNTQRPFVKAAYTQYFYWR